MPSGTSRKRPTLVVASGQGEAPTNNAKADEQALIGKAQAGDHEAFESLIRAHANQVFGFLVRWLGDREAAADLFQESTFRAFRSLHRLREGAPFRPWFFRIAVNRAKTYLGSWGAKRQQHRPLESANPERSTESPHEALEVQELLELTLARAPSSDRQLLLLRFVHESTIAEISAVLGVPAFVTKMRLSRARARFRRLFKALVQEGAKP